MLLANQRSIVIYEYACHCDSWLVDHTTQRLQKCIKQHVLKAKRQRTTATQELECNRCTRNYSDSWFKILTTVRSQFHLSLLEAIYISREKKRICGGKNSLYIPFKCFDKIRACCHYIDSISPCRQLCNRLRMHISLLYNAILLSALF